MKCLWSCRKCARLNRDACLTIYLATQFTTYRSLREKEHFVTLISYTYLCNSTPISKLGTTINTSLQFRSRSSNVKCLWSCWKYAQLNRDACLTVDLATRWCHYGHFVLDWRVIVDPPFLLMPHAWPVTPQTGGYWAGIWFHATVVAGRALQV